MNTSKLWLTLACVLAIATSACKNDPETTSEQDKATLAVKEYITGELEKLHDNAEKIEAAAPKADDDGWNLEDDKDAVEAMRDAWGKTRDEYEHVEGAIAVLFPDLDVTTDQRYDAFLDQNEGGGPDDNLFDGEGATGMHEIERILWAGQHPQNVIDFESELDGYKAAAFPESETEAKDFKAKLCKRLVDDTEQMSDEFEPLALESATAFRGVIGSMQEQVEKVRLAATAEDESRYAQRTLADMRANLEGGRKIYAAFSDWVKKDAGEDLDEKILARFAKIKAAYDDIDGDAIPAVPAGFDADEPSADDLDTTYGKLFSLLNDEADQDKKGSLANLMEEAADALNIAQLPD